MEKKHKETINRNFDFIVKNCKSDVLLSQLKSKIPISSDEFDELVAMKSKPEQCRQLFNFLMNRGPETYDAIIKSLIETNQFTVLSRLCPDVLNATNLAVQHREQQRCKKVFIEPVNYYDQSHVPVVNVTSQELPLDIVVKFATNFDYEKDEFMAGVPFYNTTSKNRGVVKVINIDAVKGKAYRTGSLMDVNNLRNLFMQMGFKVDIFENAKEKPTRANVIRAIGEFVSDSRLKSADIAMFFIMSHGGRKNGKDYIDDYDCNPIYVSEIEEFFHNNRCIYMQNKPKLIFIQACRGELPDYGVRRVTETDSSAVNISQRVEIDYMATQSDILLAQSTVAGAASLRDTMMGTWFIYLVCEVFMNHACKMDVETMLKIVYVKLQHERTTSNEMQTGESTQKTFKKCFLNPGIYREDNKICYFDYNVQNQNVS